VTARRRAEGGFTLLEVVVAMTILAVGIVLVFELFSGALRLSAGSRDASESTIYARQRMEEALLAPNPVEGREQGNFGEKYRWELDTAFIPREDEERPYDEIRFRVTIRWRDGGDERSVDLGATRWRWREKNEGA
jgi:general secretion pathway protein I